MNRRIDLSLRPALHIVGCGGTGMAPITAVLAHLGLSVSGSDQKDSPTLRSLEDVGVQVTVGADYAAIAPEALIVRSTAVPDTHPEIAPALAAGRPVYRRADALAGITAAFRTVAIAGTHGKTTTSSMTTAALLGAGLPVTSIVGGKLLGIDQVVPGAVLGDPGGILIVEADESDGTFVELAAEVAVVTNIEPDHLEYYGGEAGLYAAFDSFIANPDLVNVVLCGDDAGVQQALDRLGPDRRAAARIYGESPAAEVQLLFDPPESSVRIGDSLHSVAPRQPGRHNALNLTAAIAVVHAFDGDVVAAVQALDSFTGVGRRFERRGNAGGVEVVDDYAHLQGEILAAITAARQVCKEKVHVVFQPHRYSRTEALWHTYASALAAADSVVITDIYSSGEAPRPGISADLVFDDLRRLAPNLEISRVGSPSEVPREVARLAAPGDLCLLLSAGDLPAVADDVLQALDAAS